MNNRGRANRPAPAKWRHDAAYLAAFVPLGDGLSPKTPQQVHDDLRTIDYIPLGVYLFFFFFSVGLYPYLWLLDRVEGFDAAGATGVDRSGIRRFCVLGICAQFLLLACGAVCLWGWIAGNPEWYVLSLLMLGVYAAMMIFIVLPMRCFYHFNIRWQLRRAASRWDESSLMISRTAPSLFYLCLFGTAYIQQHINRLIGLGMPGFAGYDDVGTGTTIGDAIKEYVWSVARRE